MPRHLRAAGRWVEVCAALGRGGQALPVYQGELPPGHDGSGLGLLGTSSRELVELVRSGTMEELHRALHDHLSVDDHRLHGHEVEGDLRHGRPEGDAVASQA